LRKTCWFPLYFTLPSDGLTDFADGGYRSNLTPTAFAAVAAVHRDPHLQWAALQSVGRHIRFDHSLPEALLLLYDPTLRPEPPGEAFPLARAFRDVGWVAIRNGWGDDDLGPVIAAKAGDNRHGGCQHLDVGNVLANAFGQRMLVDHGYGKGSGMPAWTHTWEPGADGRYRWNDPLYSTPGHNVVVIGGRNQRLDGTGTIARFDNEDASYAWVTLDCTDAYDGVERATRTILHLHPDILVVHDAFNLTEPEPAALAWHTPAMFVPDALATDADLTAYLPVVRDGRFRIVHEQGATEALCLCLS
jgi:hypothetical protein